MSKILSLIVVLFVILTSCFVQLTNADATGQCGGSSNVLFNCTASNKLNPCGPKRAGECINDRCFCMPGFINRNKENGCEQAAGVGSKILSFCGLTLLLLSGKLTRVYVKPLHFLYLPSCVIGGMYGLIIRWF